MTDKQNIALGYAMRSLSELDSADRLIVAEKLVDWAREHFEANPSLDAWEKYQNALEARRKGVRDAR